MNELQEERDYLLDSLRRLEDEHQAGAIGDDEYIDLRDEQTARAAALLREIQQRSTQPVVEPPTTEATVKAPRPRALTQFQQRLVWALGVAVFVAIVIASLFGGSEDRLAGQVGTGTVNGDTNSLLAQAQEQTSTGKPADAVKTYDEVLKLDPSNAQALAYKGWLIHLAGLTDVGLQSIDKSIAANPNYPDAHFFKGYILFRSKNDPSAAVGEFEKFLASNPPQEMVPLVQQALEDAKAQSQPEPLTGK